MATSKVFRSGNSVAVRLPKSLGVEEGIEMRVSEERGKYVLEPVEKQPEKIDLTGIYGSISGMKPIVAADDDYQDLPREWHLLGLDGH